jgi:hypothetical protein
LGSAQQDPIGDDRPETEHGRPQHERRNDAEILESPGPIIGRIAGFRLGTRGHVAPQFCFRELQYASNSKIEAAASLEVERPVLPAINYAITAVSESVFERKPVPDSVRHGYRFA